MRPGPAPLSGRLGPGLLGGVFDGRLRPLSATGEDALEQGDHEDTIRRTAWARPGRSTLPGRTAPAEAEDEEARRP